MPLIQIHLAEGRTEKQKKDLMTGMTDLTEKVIDVSRDSIRVWINEFPDTNYMASGELLKDKRARLKTEKS
tara:strand:+ start:546 stop:758 length:213 start_codon:yes stop_codon:yes gene_type:complete